MQQQHAALRFGDNCRKTALNQRIRSDMNYYAYEMAHAFMSPVRFGVQALRNTLDWPLNPMAYTAAGKNMVAACEVFESITRRYGKPEFWGYYSAYDHVALCQIFGTMMELPQGWPMLTYDLRQFLDAKGLQGVTQPDDMPHHALGDARWIAETHQKVSKEGNVQSESRAASL